MLLDRPKVVNQINNLIFIIYVLLIFEGAIRKWVLPSLSSPLFFIKDPFLLFLYGLCFYKKQFPKNKYFFSALIMAFAFYLLACCQSLILEIPIIVAIYGWRNYFLYLPLAFIIGEYMQKEDLFRIAKFTCIVAIPIAILTYFQYISPKDAYINKNVGFENTTIFTIVDGIVRPSGTFSFTTGHSTFVTSLAVMLLFNFLLSKKERFLSPMMAIGCAFAFFSNLAVSGSRSAFVSVGLVVFFLAFSSLLIFNEKKGFKILLTVFVSILVAVILFNFVFEKELGLIQRRQELAQASEGSIFSRILSTVFDPSFLFMSDISLLGFGLGLSSGGGSFLANGVRSFVLAETEWSRNILEAGLLLGSLYIIYRIFLVLKIFLNSSKVMLKTKSPIPLIFFSFTFPSLFSGSITGNGTANVYNWIFVGICFAVNKIYLERKL